ncbi:hypothetical protein O3P69_007853, partial [Scylla paramamosain]
TPASRGELRQEHRGVVSRTGLPHGTKGAVDVQQHRMSTCGDWSSDGDNSCSAAPS